MGENFLGFRENAYEIKMSEDIFYRNFSKIDRRERKFGENNM